MFSGFMVGASDVLKFKSPADLGEGLKYAVEFWVFKPKITGQQFALLVVHLGEKKNQNLNVLEMDELVLPFEWNSFCISINVETKNVTVYHNGHIQAVQPFKDIESGTLESSKFMTVGHLGGSKFVGTLIDFEVFGRPLPKEDLLDWTLCQNKVTNQFCNTFFDLTVVLSYRIQLT